MKAIGFFTQGIVTQPVGQWFQEICALHGVDLEVHNIVEEGTARYAEMFRTSKNVITWNCRMPMSWLKRWGNNVLYLDNALLRHDSGIFVDEGGYYARSNLRKFRTWEQNHLVDLDAFTKDWFEWGAMAGGNPEGPILVTLQTGKDMNMQDEQFPLSKGRPDKLKRSVELFIEHLPKDKLVVVRPHPRFLEEWETVRGSVEWPDNWEVKTEGRFYDILPEYSALATVTSTTASEAVSLGLPVATLGVGAFSGSGAVLECGEDASRLGELGTWRPDTQACAAYACAIIGRHYLPYQTEPGRINLEMERWLARCR